MNRILIVLLLLAWAPLISADPGAAFTYQGRLEDNGADANGTFAMEFSLWNDAIGGSEIGATVSLPSVPVTNGIFSVSLDFGAAAFGGDPRWVEIAVAPAASSRGGLTTLSPRTAIQPTPYAIYAQNAADADTLDGLDSSNFSSAPEPDGPPTAIGRIIFSSSLIGEDFELPLYDFTWGVNYTISSDGSSDPLLSSLKWEENTAVVPHDRFNPRLHYLQVQDTPSAAELDFIQLILEDGVNPPYLTITCNSAYIGKVVDEFETSEAATRQKIGFYSNDISIDFLDSSGGTATVSWDRQSGPTGTVREPNPEFFYTTPRNLSSGMLPTLPRLDTFTLSQERDILLNSGGGSAGVSVGPAAYNPAITQRPLDDLSPSLLFFTLRQRPELETLTIHRYNSIGINDFDYEFGDFFSSGLGVLVPKYRLFVNDDGEVIEENEFFYTSAVWRSKVQQMDGSLVTFDEAEWSLGKLGGSISITKSSRVEGGEGEEINSYTGNTEWGDVGFDVEPATEGLGMRP